MGAWYSAAKNDLTLLYHADEIDGFVGNIAVRINMHYENSDRLVLVCVLKGAALFMADLTRKITVPHEHRYITAKSYIGTESAGKVEVAMIENLDLAGKDVIIVDDIVDTGLTLKTLVEKISLLGPRSVECCTLLDKRSRRQCDVNVRYVGKVIEDHFVVGYGLDFDEKYRNLPYIAIKTTGGG